MCSSILLILLCFLPVKPLIVEIDQDRLQRLFPPPRSYLITQKLGGKPYIQVMDEERTKLIIEQNSKEKTGEIIEYLLTSPKCTQIKINKLCEIKEPVVYQYKNLYFAPKKMVGYILTFGDKIAWDITEFEANVYVSD